MSGCTNPAGDGSENFPRSRKTFSKICERHAYLEVALPVSGKACIEMNGRWHVLSPGRFAAITPGVEHVEGCASARDRYTLLWLTFSRHTMIAFACNHKPNNGWHTFMNCSLNSPHVSLLQELMQNGGTDFTPMRIKKIRVNILAVLSELYAKQLDESSKQHKTAGCDKYKEVLESLNEFINTHYADHLNVDYLARMAGVSTCYLNRLFKREFGAGVQEQIILAKMAAAKKMLKSGNFMIKQIAAKCGYDDPLYFSKAFRKFYGYSPSSLL